MSNYSNWICLAELFIPGARKGVTQRIIDDFKHLESSRHSPCVQLPPEILHPPHQVGHTPATSTASLPEGTSLASAGQRTGMTGPHASRAQKPRCGAAGCFPGHPEGPPPQGE